MCINLAYCIIDADGCKGGVIQWAFDYVTINDGINTERVYPYVGKASAFARLCPAVRLYTVSHKNVPLNFSLLVDFYTLCTS